MKIHLPTNKITEVKMFLREIVHSPEIYSAYVQWATARNLTKLQVEDFFTAMTQVAHSEVVN